MADRTLECQKALVARLRAEVAEVSGRVYDRAPDNAAFPFVEIGDVVTTPLDAQAMRGGEALWQIDVWSRRGGRVEARRIMGAVYDALHWHALALEAGAAVLCRVSARRDMDDPDGVTAHGIVEVTILTDG